MSLTRRSVLHTGISLLAANLTSEALAQPMSSTGGTVLTVGAENMRTLNPAIQSGSATGAPGAQLFAGLVEIDEKFEPRPYLARSWQVSPDGLVYSFSLVANAVFHDGKPITAKDAAFSVDTARTVHPQMSVAFGPVIDAVVATGPLTLQIRLKRPFSGLLTSLTSMLVPILPEHIYGTAAGPIRQNPANSAPVGSGPYKFVEWKSGERLILEKNTSFFRPGRPHFDRLVFMLIDDPLVKALSMEKGQIDYLPFSFLRVNELTRLKANEKLTVTSQGYAALGPVLYLEFNLREAPLNDLRVRRAIAQAIDKDFITKTLHKGLSRRLDGPLHSGNAMYDASAVTMHPYDLKAANALMDAAGLKAGPDGMRVKLTLDLPTFEPDGAGLVGEYLRGQLKRIGIEIVLRRSTDLADWSSRVGQWNYQLTMNSTWNWSDPVIGVHRNFLSTNIKKQIWTNTEGYSNPTVDDVLAKATYEADPVKRKALYSEFQKLVTTDLPYVWTTEGIYTTVFNKKLTGLPNGAYGPLGPWDQLRFA